MVKKNAQTNLTEAVEIEGKTVEDAIEKGLRELGLSREQAEIKILSEGAAGLFGLMGSKAAKISIQSKTGHAAARPFNAPQDIKDAISKSLLNQLIQIIQLMRIADKLPIIQIEPAEAGFSVKIDFQDSSDGSLLIGKGGKTLSALGTIIQSMINHEFRDKIGDSPLPKISIDVNQYRIRQDEKTRDNVSRVIETIRKTGKPYRLNPMPARMRRIVHVALKENSEFESFSEGEGENRRVVIRPRAS